MRIVLITACFPTSRDEEAVFPAAWELAKALRSSGHELLILTFDQNKDAARLKHEMHSGMDVYRVGASSHGHALLSELYAVPRLVEFLSQALHLYRVCRDIVDAFCPDVIECQDFNGLGLFWALEGSYPLVVRCYGPLTFQLRTGKSGRVSAQDSHLIAAMEYGTLSLADGVITICDDLAERLSAETHIPIEKFTVIKTPYVPPANLPERKLPRSLNFPNILYWGRIERQKGCDILVESLPQLAREYPGFSLTLAGKEVGELGDPQPYSDTMRKRLHMYGLGKKVKFLGHQPRSAIIDLAVNADICVFPSTYETAGYTGIEAASYGAAVIASRVGGVSTYLEHEKTALLINPGDAQALSQAIIRLCKDDALRATLGKNAAALIPEICAPDPIAAQTVSWYKECISRYKSAPVEARVKASAYVMRCIMSALTGDSLEKSIRASNKTHVPFGAVYDVHEAYEKGHAKGKAEAPRLIPLLRALARAASQRISVDRIMRRLKLKQVAKSVQ